MSIVPSLPCPIKDVLDPKVVAAHFLDQQKPVDAVPTPLQAWNAQCRDDGGGVGIARGWHVTLAGSTGSGKSVLGLNVAAEAVRHGEHVGFISLEMSRAQLTTRLYAIITNTPVQQLERGATLQLNSAKRVEEMLGEIRDRTHSRFFVNERPLTVVRKVTGLMAYLQETHDCRFFVLDYVQLLGAGNDKRIFDRVAEVSARVRELAQARNVITIGLSQLNRQTSANREQSPIIQGLMGSSSIENDSDQVLLLDHSRYQKDGPLAKTWLVLGKNRHGSPGQIPIEWDYRTLRIRQIMPDEEAS